MSFSLKIRKVNFTARCTHSASLRRFSAHMLRGAFGNTLVWLSRPYSKDRSRVNRRYDRINSEVYKSEGTGKYKAHAGGIHYNPYVFECEAFDERKFPPGDRLKFSAVFAGDFADAHVTDLIKAVKLMIEGDFCGEIDCFALETAQEDSNGEHYYKDGRHCGTPPCWDWCDRYNIPGPVQKISICFDEKSPASFTGESKETLADLPFELLFKQALCRVEGLCVDHSGGEQTIENWDGLLNRAASVRVLSSSLRILENIKVQQKGPDFGITGEISYGGELTEFLPYINVCSVLHIGHGTSLMGLGRYDWRIG
jgi:hypothetical protein